MTKKTDYSHITATISSNPCMWGSETEEDDGLIFADRYAALLRCKFPGINVEITGEEYTDVEDSNRETGHASDDEDVIRDYMGNKWPICCADHIESVLDEVLGKHEGPNANWSSAAWALGYKHDGKPVWLVDGEDRSFSLIARSLIDDDESEELDCFDLEETLLPWLVCFKPGSLRIITQPVNETVVWNVVHPSGEYLAGGYCDTQSDATNDAQAWIDAYNAAQSNRPTANVAQMEGRAVRPDVALKAAADAVLKAWDDFDAEDAGPFPLDDLMEALRRALVATEGK